MNNGLVNVLIRDTQVIGEQDQLRLIMSCSGADIIVPGSLLIISLSDLQLDICTRIGE